MWNEPRNWKWMVPGALGVVCAVGGAWMLVQLWDWWTWVSAWGIAFLCTVAMGVNWWAYVQMHAVNHYVATRAAQNATPEVRMFEAAKGMHPDAVAALLTHRRMIWEIPYVAVGKLVDWVLQDAPGVRAGFLDFVLDYSSDVSVMPKSMLSEGSKQFDPDGQITDYEQYDSLILLLRHKLMCTEALGNQAPKWIPPWKPDLVRHRFGLVEGVYEAEGTGMMKAIERARETGAGPGADPLRAVKEKIAQDALDGLQQTAEMRKKYQLSMKKMN